MSQQLALWDEASALSQAVTSDAALMGRARAALRIAARLVTLDVRLNANEIDEVEHATALDALVVRAANLFTVEQHADMEVPA